MKPSDLADVPLLERIQERILITPETREAMQKLAAKLANSPKNLSALPIPAPSQKEFERSFRLWASSNSLDPKIRDRANLIGISKGYDAAMEYYRSVYLELHPEMAPNKKVGRPTWYVSPAKERGIIWGDVLYYLLEIGAKELERRLASDLKKVA